MPNESVCTGSPPQAWGRLETGALVFDMVRFTPTGVGTAFNVPRAAFGMSVHPHRRGDGVRDVVNIAAGAGSPPQAWGRLVVIDRLFFRGRFTPTGVGTARATPRD